MDRENNVGPLDDGAEFGALKIRYYFRSTRRKVVAYGSHPLVSRYAARDRSSAIIDTPLIQFIPTATY
jgi:hypothetical protein